MLDNYQCCNRCVMDTSDPEITFDRDGICNHCRAFDTVTCKGWFPNEEGKKRLDPRLPKHHGASWPEHLQSH